MRAGVFHNGKFAVVDVVDPRPEPGQLLVRTLACGICGTDLHFLRNAQTIVGINDELWPTLGPAAVGDSHVDLSKDVFMGHEFCGEVLEAGPGTDGPPPGTAVVSVPVLLSKSGVHRLTYNNDYPCGYAQLMLLSAPLVVPVPNGLPPRLAALTEPLAVGVHAVAKSAVQPGETAVVLGCGPIGLAIIAALRIAGVHTVIGADFSVRRRELAGLMGATQTVDPAAESAIQAGRRAAGTAPLVVFEAVGVPGIIQQIMHDVPIGARIVVAGLCMQPDTIVPYYGIAKELSVQFVVAYSLEEFASALAAIADGRVDVTPMITGTVGLDGLPGAFDALADPAQHCKILVEPAKP
ncbi:MAG TPA: zinc-binding dehydrogenase [Mycobacterium sp.]|nr:zinc-binding dehydrogenase [Mycobacterium sp.]HTX96123.1 zinc-binding dehydrogenase [Mycobacterium sp.]